MTARYTARATALTYLALLLILPLSMVLWRTFGDGTGAVWNSIFNTDTVHALGLTLLIALIAVPANTVVGVLCALLLVRRNFKGKSLLNLIIDLPFAVSPVVVGLALILVYGSNGWFGGAFEDLGIQVIFSLPGMVLATIFISLPFVVREVVPVLEEIGTDQERAAWTLGATPLKTFWQVTLPSLRWAITYGVVLTTARSIGEFGAVAVVSGRLVGKTETLPLHVESRFQAFDLTGAYSTSMLLALIAVATVLAMRAIGPKEHR